MLRIFNKSFNKSCKKHVTTWSPLATVFNTKPASNTNFWKSQETVNIHTKIHFIIKNKLLTNENILQGLFGIEELKSPNGFYELTDRVLSKSNALIEETTSVNRKRKMVEVFDELSNELCKVADLAEFIRLVHPQESYSTAAQHAHAKISSIVEKYVEIVSLKNTVVIF